MIVERPGEDGWGVGRLADGTEGRFPGNYVSIAEQRGMSIRERGMSRGAEVDRAKNRAKMSVQVRRREGGKGEGNSMRQRRRDEKEREAQRTKGASWRGTWGTKD